MRGFSILTAIVALFGAMSCSSIERLDFSHYRGDARVWVCTEDDAYPKYWLLFQPLRLDVPGEYVFHAKGLPESGDKTSHDLVDGYQMGLAFAGMPTDAERKAIVDAKVKCTVEIECEGQSNGNRLVGGSLDKGEGAGEADWYFADTFWCEGTRRGIYIPTKMGKGGYFHPDPARAYKITVQVRREVGAEDRTSPQHLPTLTLAFWAGGLR